MKNQSNGDRKLDLPMLNQQITNFILTILNCCYWNRKTVNSKKSSKRIIQPTDIEVGKSEGEIQTDVDVDDQPIEFSSNNPLTGTRKYQVEYEDGTIEELTTKVITGNLLAEISPEGNQFPIHGRM